MGASGRRIATVETAVITETAIPVSLQVYHGYNFHSTEIKQNNKGKFPK